MRLSHRRHISSRALLASLGSLLMLLTACSGNSGPDAAADEESGAAATLTFGLTSPSMNFLPYYVAQERGLFDDRALTVEEVQVDGSAVAIRAAVSGDVDLMGLLPEGALTGIAQGATMKIVGATNNKIAYQLFVRPGITSIDDLAAKKIAILTQGNGTDILMRWLLDEEGQGADKSTFIAAGGMKERLAAMTNGQVDATLLAPPFAAAALSAGMTQLGDLTELIPSYNGPNVIAATDRSIEEKRQAVQDFMSAMAEAAQWVLDNPDKAIAIGQERLGLEPDAARSSFAFLENSWSADASADEEGIRFSIALLKEYGQLEEPLTLEQVYTDEFAGRA